MTEQNYKETNTEQLKKELKNSLNIIAKPLKVIQFTRENYNKLFPRRTVETPIETVKLGEHQFEKLEKKDRELYLQAVYETLKEPDFVINEERKNVFDEQEKAHLYVKSFLINEKTKSFQSVVVSIDDENVSITNHPRNINNILNKIKRPDQILFISDEVRSNVEQHTQTSIVQSVVNTTRNLDSSKPLTKTVNQSDSKVNTNAISELKQRFELTERKGAEYINETLDLRKENAELKEENEKQRKLLNGNIKLEVNGKNRNFPNGLLAGAITCLERLDEANKKIEKLNSIIQEQQKSNIISPKSQSDDSDISR